jgi:prepilin-type processing-associated H-X9-DG protein
MRIYASDHDDRFPWMVSTNPIPERPSGSLEFADSANLFRHYQAASNELNNPKVLRCPMDTTRSRAFEFTNLANTNISYFLGLDSAAGRPETILSGDRDMLGGRLFNPNFRLVRANDVLKWGRTLHDSGGNIGMADGSAQQVNDARLNQQLQAGFARTNQLRFAIP